MMRWFNLELAERGSRVDWGWDTTVAIVVKEAGFGVRFVTLATKMDERGPGE
jgi:hypothetical protein